MASCPSCSGIMLRHVRGSDIYWFCRHCWQEMPEFSNTKDRFNQLVSTRKVSQVVVQAA
ncbi:hypothetical protein [Calothrix sp. 336/3]|uniref:hypothetical protein n=1 Tax=Calothrix sp. 336/3 TaxID=1337936 RepID=UPI000A96D313|nr:hypothetical protein [Calothrix sp. 336/3]